MSRIDGGSLFHVVGLATQKALEPMSVVVRGISYSPWAAESKWTQKHVITVPSQLENPLVLVYYQQTKVSAALLVPQIQIMDSLLSLSLSLSLYIYIYAITRNRSRTLDSDMTYKALVRHRAIADNVSIFNFKLLKHSDRKQTTHVSTLRVTGPHGRVDARSRGTRGARQSPHPTPCTTLLGGDSDERPVGYVHHRKYTVVVAACRQFDQFQKRPTEQDLLCRLWRTGSWREGEMRHCYI